ncbi:MobF family relaxase [Microlunatus parietis]|uniref:TrwC relaxase domain-containing protein n=1 Tax=Microlunatus parietis TaxID=682979 RepID=A0A7Y9I7T9_9ACTN|nr:MobF family relaxase [Microlunatus parietis]NYE71889.1 hypothetical protein [Microlunatus parietis]
MLTVNSGHSASYLTDAIATGRENYYTGAVTEGEPPGRWQGAGAALLGLHGEVDAQDMQALYERFLDPRADGFRDPEKWEEVEKLGHDGRHYPTEDAIYAAALEREPGADAERRAALRIEAGQKARKNVAFHDATFSVQKSVTVLHTAFEAQAVQAQNRLDDALAALAAAEQDAAGAAVHPAGAPVQPVHGVQPLEAAVRRARREVESWAAYRTAVEDAIWAGNNAALGYLSEKAGYARVGHHGGNAGRWADAHDWVVASFFQHDSRNHDPQLHIHNAILNRVQGEDGKWRTIDSRALHKYKGSAGAVAERVMEQHLTRALGVQFATRPDGAAREIVGIDQSVMDLFSSRKTAIGKKAGELVAAFESKFGRAPNALELNRLKQQATLATRRAKSHDGETVAERLDRWDQQLRAEVAGGLATVADQALAARTEQPPGGGEWTETAVLQAALARVHETRASWNESDLTRAISDSLPDHLGNLQPGEITELLDRLTQDGVKLATPLEPERPGEAVLPDELRLANGASSYQAPGGRVYATPGHLHTEKLLHAADRSTDRRALDPATAQTVIATVAAQGTELGADQAAAITGILTSGARIETLIGPAGTGKSFLLGTLANAWEDPALWGGEQRRVVGLATAQIATDILAAEGLTARNTTQWLGMQDRIAAGDARPEERAWALSAGDLVVVDESGMADTAALARIYAHAEQAGAKLLLVGDHRQLSAVGAAGGMDLAAAAGPRYELTETRRFAEDWEGPASLRLREHDTTVLGEYHRQGRLIDGGAVEQTEQAAGRAWLADTLEERRSLLIVDSNEQAARLSGDLRARLVDLGRVDDERTVQLGLQGLFAGAGDVVQARENAWHLAGYAGNRRAPRNRDEFKITDVHDDGSITCAPIDRDTGRPVDGETLRLPADYVSDKLALGYAYTVHAVQGVTVDTTHSVVSARTGADALYVGMSRGRHANTAHVVTRDRPDQAQTGEVLEAVHRDPQAVLATVLETDQPELSALAHAAEAADENAAIRTPGELFADACEIAIAGRTERWLDELVQAGTLTEGQRATIAAEDGAATLTRLLRRVEIAGHDPRATLVDAVERRDLDDARQITNVLHSRITDHTTTLDPTGDGYADWIPAIEDGQWSAYLQQLAADADERQTELGVALAASPPQWAVESLGSVPEDGNGREGWISKVGIVAAHRELTGHDDAAEALGSPPKPGQVEAYASWHAAWRALGRPVADRAEAEMSTGQLRVRIAAYEREKTWAPAYVADQLAATRQTAEQRRNDAALLNAQADAVEDPAERHRLLDEAGDAAALAETIEAQAAELAAADEARAQWYAHTAETRAAAERAAAELPSRDDAALDEEPVTAEEWLAARREADAEEDPHREITGEHELADAEQQRDQDLAAVRPEPAQVEPVAELDEPDIRVETEGAVEVEDRMRVPSAEESAAAVRNAQRAIVEIRNRQTIEDQRVVDEQAEQDDELARWHTDQQQADSRSDVRQDDDGPALELTN